MAYEQEVNNAIQGAGQVRDETIANDAQALEEMRQSQYKNNWLAKRDAVNNSSNASMQNYLGASSAYASKGMGGGSAGGLQAQMNAQNQQAAAQASQDMAAANNEADEGYIEGTQDSQTRADAQYNTNVDAYRGFEDQLHEAAKLKSELNDLTRADVDDYMNRLNTSNISTQDYQSISDLLAAEGWDTGGNMLSNRSENADSGFLGAAGNLGGGYVGATVGWKIGGAVGSIVPGVGTVIGAGIGAGLGILFGSAFGAQSGASLQGTAITAGLGDSLELSSFSDMMGTMEPAEVVDPVAEAEAEAPAEDVEAPVESETPSDTTVNTQVNPQWGGLSQSDRDEDSMSALLQQGGY